jgi:hypothetical protein
MLIAAVALLVPAAAGAAPPAAITGPVTAVGPSSANATGTVNPGGQATTWYVEYGTSTSYGSRTPNRSAGSGTANVAVSAPLSGLAPGTTYHYRVVATNAAGTSRGADGIFVTLSPPSVATGAATDVSVTSATLTGAVDPNGRATTWYFEYGTSTGYGSRTPDRSAGAGTSSLGVSAPVSGLARGRVYHYRLVATSDAGTSHGADRTFSTIGAPTAVTDPAFSITPTSGRLNGTVMPNGQSTSWFFEYGTSTRYGSRTPRRNAGSGTNPARVSEPLTRLRPATTYHYRLVARNASGTSVGADRTFDTSFPPGVVTGAPQNVGPTSATAVGSVDPRGRSTRWWFEWGTSTAYGSRTPTRSAGSRSGAQAVGVTLEGLRPTTTYHYRLIATSDAGTSRGADVSFTTTGVTLTAAALRVVHGRAVLLSGFVPTRRTGELVTLFAQPYGGGSLRSVATIVTGDGGSWSYLAKPAIRTEYRASWLGAMSPETVVGVRPAVSFRRLAGGARFTTRLAPRAFAGRRVQLQRRTASGRWVTVRRVRLGPRSGATFRATLPRGRSVLRIAISVNQAGAGYLAGFSRTIVLRR